MSILLYPVLYHLWCTTWKKKTSGSIPPHPIMLGVPWSLWKPKSKPLALGRAIRKKKHNSIQFLVSNYIYIYKLEPFINHERRTTLLKIKFYLLTIHEHLMQCWIVPACPASQSPAVVWPRFARTWTRTIVATGRPSPATRDVRGIPMMIWWWFFQREQQ